MGWDEIVDIVVEIIDDIEYRIFLWQGNVWYCPYEHIYLSLITNGFYVFHMMPLVIPTVQRLCVVD